VHSVTSDKPLIERQIGCFAAVLIGLSAILALSGCGKGGNDATLPGVELAIKKRAVLPVPTPEKRGTAVKLDHHVTFEGYTIRLPSRVAAGSVVGATVYFRSLKRQDGQFKVTLHLLSGDRMLDNRKVNVSTARWPVQTSFLGENEVFWGHAELRMPLGLHPRSVEIGAVVEFTKPDTGSTVPLQPPIRFAP